MTEAVSSPLAVYAAIVLGVIIAAATAVPKIHGPNGTVTTTWAEARREERIAPEGADVRDLKRQTMHLEDRLSEKDREHSDYRRRVAARKNQWRTEKSIHDRWDYQMQQALIGHDPPIDLTPEYMTPNPHAHRRLRRTEAIASLASLTPFSAVLVIASLLSVAITQAAKQQPWTKACTQLVAAAVAGFLGLLSAVVLGLIAGVVKAVSAALLSIAAVLVLARALYAALGYVIPDGTAPADGSEPAQRADG